MVDKTGCTELPQLGRWASVFVDGLDQRRLGDLSNTDKAILDFVHDLIPNFKVEFSLVGKRVELLKGQKFSTVEGEV
jgi:hypothetical protein